MHLSWDWTWDMAAIGTVFFLFIGVCASYFSTRASDRRGLTDAQGEAVRRVGVQRSHWPLRVLATTALLVLAVSWLFPYLSVRAERAAVAADQNAALALREAERAARYNPLSVEPLLTQSLALQRLGKSGQALTVLRRAQRLQPDNSAAYYQEGIILLSVYNQPRRAAVALRRALALNPHDVPSEAALARTRSR